MGRHRKNAKTTRLMRAAARVARLGQLVMPWLNEAMTAFQLGQALGLW
jgi:hypothetical protein